MCVFLGTPLHIPVDDESDEPGSEASDAKSTPTVEGGSSLSHYFEIYSSQLLNVSLKSASIQVGLTIMKTLLHLVLNDFSFRFSYCSDWNCCEKPFLWSCLRLSQLNPELLLA